MKHYLVLYYCSIFCHLAFSAPTEDKDRITSNDFASLGEFPYQVSLQRNGGHTCGGSLISETHVLTAAHCVDGKDSASFKIAVGTITVPGEGTIYDVASIAMYPEYIKESLTGDVAVIRLAEPVKLSENVQTIELPEPNFQVGTGDEFIVSGWGTDVMNGTASPELKKLTMTGVSREECEQLWGSFVSDNKGLLCLDTPSKDGVCQGDSGGPLTVDKQVVVGIVSAGSSSGCGTGKPDLFTSVSYYLDFIKSQTANN